MCRHPFQIITGHVDSPETHCHQPVANCAHPQPQLSAPAALKLHHRSSSISITASPPSVAFMHCSGYISLPPADKYHGYSSFRVNRLQHQWLTQFGTQGFSCSSLQPWRFQSFFSHHSRRRTHSHVRPSERGHHSSTFPHHAHAPHGATGQGSENIFALDLVHKRFKELSKA